jgi:hypothetical protein
VVAVTRLVAYEQHPAAQPDDAKALAGLILSSGGDVIVNGRPIEVVMVAPDMADVTFDDGETYRLPLRSLDELLVDGPELSWVWQHYIAREGKTLLVARPKVGKSTTVFGLMAALRTGEVAYCGVPVGENVGVIYATEESSRDAIRNKANAAGLKPSDDGLKVIRRVDVTEQRWEKIVPVLHADARTFREQGEFDDVLIVIDTLARWAGFEDENDAKTAHAIELLDPMAADGFALLIVHHAGWREDRMRGSSAIAASVDVLLFLGGEPGTSSTRTLKYQGGRLDTGDTPESLNIAYDPEGHVAAFAHGVRQSSADAWFETLAQLKELDPTNTGVTTDDIAEAIDRTPSTARRHLNHLAKLGHVTFIETFTARGRERLWVRAETSPFAELERLYVSQGISEGSRTG